MTGWRGDKVTDSQTTEGREWVIPSPTRPLTLSLLSREDFRSQVFDRDDGRCVICGESGVDAHHIIERRLFPDGGYYLDNGATLCGACHIRAEMTVLSCAEIRAAAGITQIVLPPHVFVNIKSRRMIFKNRGVWVDCKKKAILKNRVE